MFLVQKMQLHISSTAPLLNLYYTIEEGIDAFLHPVSMPVPLDVGNFAHIPLHVGSMANAAL